MSHAKPGRVYFRKTVNVRRVGNGTQTFCIGAIQKTAGPFCAGVSLLRVTDREIPEIRPQMFCCSADDRCLRSIIDLMFDDQGTGIAPERSACIAGLAYRRELQRRRHIRLRTMRRARCCRLSVGVPYGLTTGEHRACKLTAFWRRTRWYSSLSRGADARRQHLRDRLSSRTRSSFTKLASLTDG
jgi:hypothetical protein